MLGIRQGRQSCFVNSSKIYGPCVFCIDYCLCDIDVAHFYTTNVHYNFLWIGHKIYQIEQEGWPVHFLPMR